MDALEGGGGSPWSLLIGLLFLLAGTWMLVKRERVQKWDEALPPLRGMTKHFNHYGFVRAWKYVLFPLVLMGIGSLGVVAGLAALLGN